MKNKKLISVVCVFLAVITIPGSVSIFAAQKDFSENENRALSLRPDFSFSELMSGLFQLDYENYLSDQFFMRDECVAIKTKAMMLLGKKDINGIYIGKDGYLIEKYLPSDFSSEKTENNIDILASFLNDMSADYSARCVIVPSKASVLKNKLPDNLKVYSTDFVAQRLKDKLCEDVGFVCLDEALREHEDEYIYYKTDHHWTSLGAYYGYKEICEKLLNKKITDDMFVSSEVASGFSGTDSDKLRSVGGDDTVVKYEYNTKKHKGDIKVKVDYNGEEKNSKSLYAEKNLNEKDKYTYFLGGNYPRIDIYSDIDSDNTLLLIKDSFSNCLLPFLVGDYAHIIVLDLRYFKQQVSDVLDEEFVDDIMVIYNTEKFIDDDNQKYLLPSDSGYEGLDIPEDEELEGYEGLDIPEDEENNE